MDFVPMVLLFTFPVILSYLMICKNRHNKRKALPPGPLGLPIIGNLLDIGNASIHLRLWELSRKYGPLMSLRFGLRPAIIVSSASLAKEVLKNYDPEFAGRPSSICSQKTSYNGLDIVFSNGNYWREIRKLGVVNLFSAKRVQSFSSIRKEEVRRMIKKIRTKSASSDKVVNLSTLTMSFANSVICRIAFGKSYEEDESAALDEATNFYRLLSEIQAVFTQFFFSDYIPFMAWLDRFRGLLSRLNKNFEEFDDFYERIIQDHLDDKRSKNEDHEDITDVMLRHVKENSSSISNLSYNHIKAVLMDIFIAGSDTTASTLVWAMTALAKHPRAMEKVKTEIKDVCGEKEFVHEDDMERLPYLRAVVKETLRMFPPAPLLLPRETIRRCNLNGYEIQPKTLVYINAWAVGRDPEAWEEPEMFHPERFLNTSIDFKGQHYEFIPFGGGRRICPGMQMATSSVELALANLIHAFNWELPSEMKEDDIDIEPAPGITVHKKIPLCLVASC